MTLPVDQLHALCQGSMLAVGKAKAALIHFGRDVRAPIHCGLASAGKGDPDPPCKGWTADGSRPAVPRPGSQAGFAAGAGCLHPDRSRVSSDRTNAAAMLPGWDRVRLPVTLILLQPQPYSVCTV